MKKCKLKGKNKRHEYNNGKHFSMKFAMNLSPKKRILNKKILTTDPKEKVCNFWLKVNNNLSKFMKRIKNNSNPLKTSILQLKRETGTGNKSLSHIQNLEINKCPDTLDPIAWTDSPWPYIQSGTQTHSNNAHC